MAHGGPDYWAQPITGLPSPSVFQVWTGGVGSAFIAGGGNANLAANAVPAGHRLYIASGIITTNGPGIHGYVFRLGGVAEVVPTFFDTIGYLPFNPSGMRSYDALDTVDIQVTNFDVVAHTFTVQWWGFYVIIVPGAPDPVGLGLAIQGAGL